MIYLVVWGMQTVSAFQVLQIESFFQERVNLSKTHHLRHCDFDGANAVYAESRHSPLKSRSLFDKIKAPLT